jgi:FixJ family two-component response regulator
MLADLRELGVMTPIIMISGQATVDMAVRATRLGALDFLREANLGGKAPADGRRTR